MVGTPKRSALLEGILMSDTDHNEQSSVYEESSESTREPAVAESREEGDDPFQAEEVDSVKSVSEQIERAKQERLIAQLWVIFGAVFFGIGIICVVTTVITYNPIHYKAIAYYLLSFIVIVMGLMLWLTANHLANFHTNIVEELEFEKELRLFRVNPVQRRAEKLLRINQFQLRQYYGLNLRENNRVFLLGIGCIIIGASVVGTVLGLVTYLGTELGTENEARTQGVVGTQIIIGCVGAVGSLLINYVAVIYLKMHASASSNLSDFHARLIETHQLLLANFFSAQIFDDEKRWEVLSKMATNLSTSEGPQRAPNSTKPPVKAS